MSFVTVGNVPCSAGSLSVQLGGCWLLHVSLSADAMAASDGDQVDAVFGDIALHGTVYRGGNFTGEGQLLVRGGYGGWSQPARPKFYYSPYGLQAAQVVSDVAKEVGEKMASPAPGTAGIRWVRLGAPYPAARVLQLLCPQWWIDFDGSTHPSPRPSGAMTEVLNVISDATSLSEGRVLCAPALLAGVLPGKTFSTPSVAERTASAVVHRVTDQSIRTEIWTT